MRVAVSVLILAALLGSALLAVDLGGLVRWAAEWQRAFQREMAAAVHALRSGQPGALAALLAAAGAYGFVHAVGPGHGKYLIGGAGLGSSVPVFRLLGIAIAASLAQAFWAILLVYGGFSLLELTAPRMTALTEDYLAPASYAAIAAIGAVFVWRGVWALVRKHAQRAGGAVHHTHGQSHGHSHAHDHSHSHDCGCHAHGPSPAEVAGLRSARDVAALIVSIAMRPCTGALFLLVIAWQMEIRLAGALAVIVMGMGTAALTSLVAVSSIAARGLAVASFSDTGAMARAIPSLQIVAGSLILWMSLSLLGHSVA